MYFYEIFVADISYKKDEPLTYHSELLLSEGSIVELNLKQKNVLGVIVARSRKPRFATKPIISVFELPSLPKQLLDLAKWMLKFYPAGVGATMQQFLPQSLFQKHQYDAKTVVVGSENLDLPKLTKEQQSVLRQIDHPDSYLLHGDTGSGKTRVYIELARKAFEQHTSCIILTPEIGLTPQLLTTFQSTFGEHSIVLTHSQLTKKQRAQTWLQILRSEHPLIVIGPRSALFSPLKRVGLIILDEEHEPSYKQEQAPHYHAAKVAARLAHLHKAILVLGSATPLVNDYFIAQSKGKAILRMRQSAVGSGGSEPTMHIVNINDRRQFTKQQHISDILLQSVEQSLQRREQSLIFLNRRGTARVILCEQCGWQAACEHCNVPLTYHGDTYQLRCHTCGRTTSGITTCPICQSSHIIMKVIGTKAVFDELQSAFPQAKIQRFDTDNKKHERLEAHYQAIRAGELDILIGTQLIAKGLDLPNLSTVGIVVADTSLYLPDYSAQERTYQLLRQVIGRVGRGHRPGTVVIQTYNTESAVVRAAANNEWDAFYKNELTERKKFLFPPYCHVLKISVRRASSKSAQTTMQKAIDTLRDQGLHVLIDGPSPSFYEKIGTQYQWQAIIKSKQRGELLKAISLLPAQVLYDIDPLNLL